MKNVKDITTNEVLDAMEDRDNLTITMFFTSIAVCILSYLNILPKEAAIFIWFLPFLSRVFFKNRRSTRVSKVTREIKKEINKMRSAPGFLNGDLDYILLSITPNISEKVKNECIEKLLQDREIFMGHSGEYMFSKRKGDIRNEDYNASR